MKIKLAERGVTLKSYILGLIEKDLHSQQYAQLDAEAIRTVAQKIQESASELLTLTEQ